MADVEQEQVLEYGLHLYRRLLLTKRNLARMEQKIREVNNTMNSATFRKWVILTEDMDRKEAGRERPSTRHNFLGRLNANGLSNSQARLARG